MSESMRSNIHRFRLQRSPSSRQPNDASRLSRDTPACERCRQFKKKCSRTFPVCTLCAKAKHPCSYSTKGEPSSIEVNHLRARVEWLTTFLNQHVLPGTACVESIDTGTDLKAIAGDTISPRTSTASVIDQALSTGASVSSSGVDSSVVILEEQNSGAFEGQPGIISPISSHEVPRDSSIARRFVDAYFQHVNRAYPFVNRAKIMQALKNYDYISSRQRDDDSALLNLVISIGYTTLRRAGQLPSNSIPPSGVEYAEIMNYCLFPERVDAVQILILLAIYSFFDPAGPSAWSVVGIASRQAMMLGLSRRGTSAETLSAIDVELRYRLYWSIFVLDRMIAYCSGLPFALTDINADVPLPGLTIEEFASPDRPQYASILQTNRHVIELRKIEGRILSHIHHKKHAELISLSHGDRRSILREIRSDIDTWYSNGSLVSPQTVDNVGIHDSIIWSSARYYHLLLMLYYPCPFNSFHSGVSGTELLRFAQKHLQSTSALLQGRQLPLNWPTLSRLLPVALVLVHGSIASVGQDSSPFPARDEVDLLVGIFDAFPESWSHARKASRILRHFTNTASSYTSLVMSSTVFSNGQLGGDGGSYAALFLPIKDSLVALIEEVLGKATSYIFHKYPDEGGSGDMAILGRGQHASFPSWPPLSSALIPISSDGESSMSGWGSMGLGFL